MRQLAVTLRSLARRPSFTAVAVLTLAVGVASTTAVFSVIRGVLLRPLPYQRSDRLVGVWERDATGGRDRQAVCAPVFDEWRRRTDLFDGVAAYRDGYGIALTGDGDPVRVPAAITTPGLFAVLRTVPQAGRALAEKDAAEGANRVAVISDGLWRRRFAGAGGAIGRVVVMDGSPVEIVGVMPPGFSFPSPGTDVWLPLGLDGRDLADWQSHSLAVIGRLRPGWTAGAARERLDALAARLDAHRPEVGVTWRTTVLPFKASVVEPVRGPLLALLAAVALVLAVAVANVANLFLVRIASQRRELAIRRSLGASRRRVMGELLVEGAVVGAAAGAVGVPLAAWAVAVGRLVGPGILPRMQEVRVDAAVLGFAVVVALGAGVAAALVPAWRWSGGGTWAVLRVADRSSTADGDGARLRRGLVVAEVAAAVVVVAAAGVVLRSLANVLDVETGFDPDGVLTANLLLSSSRYPDMAGQAAFFDEVVRRAEALPGVVAAGATTDLPFSRTDTARRLLAEDVGASRGQAALDVPFRLVTPGYFRTMGVSVLAGRVFGAADRAGGPAVVVVNRSLAERMWPGERAVGRRVRFDGSDGPRCEVVGVVADTANDGLERSPGPAVYAPHRQRPWPWMTWMTVVVRASEHPEQLAPALRSAVWAVDTELPVEHVRTMADLMAASVSPRRFATIALTVFAAAASVLAVVGLYAAVACTVSLRRREIGVRMALGAGRREVVHAMVGSGFAMAVVGVGLGLAVSLLALRLLESGLFGVSPGDPVTLAGTGAGVLLVAVAAAAVPAWRAARLDPAEVLREP